MLNAFLLHIKKESLFLPHQPILLTVSGGIDSVVMVELFRQAGFLFGIAHCNFRLRGQEADRDEHFVRELAAKLQVRFYSKCFQTEQYARAHHLSIQMAARELRYQWFNELITRENFDYVATAHHLDDQIETLMINLIRGTGLDGLQGIYSKQGKIIRPLMFATRFEIEQFRNTLDLPFCEDSSNQSIKYTRNKIRHEIMPVLNSINPDFQKGLTQTIERLRDVRMIVREKIEEKKKFLCTGDGNALTINISELRKLTPTTAYLSEFLSPLGFNYPTVKKIDDSLTGISGKLFLSPTHCLLKDRKLLIVQPLHAIKSIPVKEYFIDGDVSQMDFPLSMNFRRLNIQEGFEPEKNPKIAHLDLALIRFPLTLRRWKKGDRFQPFGMYHTKKLSDFFTDEKFSLFEKTNRWILESDGKIIWLIGHRIDNRFRITSQTRQMLRIEWLG